MRTSFARLADGTHPDSASFGTYSPSIFFPTDVNIVPCITPIGRDGQPILDEYILTKMLQHIWKLGCRHIFALGETGEFRSLSNKQRQDFAKVLVPLAKKLGFKVYINATAENYTLTQANYQEFKNLGPDAIIFAPLWGENAELMPAICNGDFIKGPPLVLYNNPAITNGCNIAAGDLRNAAFYIAALKDSSGDPARFDIYRMCLNTTVPAPLLYVGNESLALDLFGNLNMDGCVGSSGMISNHLPRLFANSVEAGRRDAHKQEFKAAIMSISDEGSCMVSGIKHVLHALEIIPTADLHPQNSAPRLSSNGKKNIAKLVAKNPDWILAA